MKKEIKGFICGIIVATIGITTVTAAVQQFTLTKVDYPVTINGLDYKDSELPLMNYEGRTYAPLNSMLTAAGLNVGFVDGKVIVSEDVVGQEKVSVATPNPTQTPITSKSEYSFGDTFKFDGLEITFGSAIQWTSVNNQFSDLNNSVVFKVPMIIKNIGSDINDLNLFYYKQYGSKGVALDSVGSYFDDDVRNAGDMRPGATQNTSIHFLFDGDGDYFIEFDNRDNDKATVKFTINKSGTQSKTNNTITTSDIKMYKEFPTVPDFGAIYNVTLSLNHKADDGSNVYLYKLEFDPNKISEYDEMLNSQGFEYYGSFDADDGSSVIIFKKNKTIVTVGMMLKQFAITVTQE